MSSRFLKRARPPNNITLSASSSDFQIPTTPAPAVEPPPFDEAAQRAAASGARDGALKILSLVPRDGILVRELQKKSPMTLSRFIISLNFLRHGCDLLIFHRGSLTGAERISWRLTAAQDTARLPLGSVCRFLSHLAATWDNSRGSNNRKGNNGPEESKTASVEVNDPSHLETPEGKSSFRLLQDEEGLIDDLIATLRRDLAQERAARLSAETRARRAEAAQLALLRVVAMEGKNVLLKRKRRRVAEQYKT